MKFLAEKLHGCDQFGEPFGLNHRGQSTLTTISGGVASIVLRALILTYLMVKFINVYNFKDPQINGYEIIENRYSMETPMNMADYHLSFYFGFMDARQTPKELDPRIGSFKAKKLLEKIEKKLRKLKLFRPLI